MQQQC